jgi:hypothetical protein
MKTVRGGEPKPAAAPSGVLDRPIDTSAEDKLERGRFIQRLADAVITRTTNKATGIIIGITGPWGSGMSGISAYETDWLS